MKILPDGKVLLSRGLYMEPDLPRPVAGHKSWTIKRLMDDDTVIATADSISVDVRGDDYMFHLETVANKNQVKLRFRAPSYKMMLDHFYDWVDKGLKHMINEDQTREPGKIVMLGNGFYLEEDPAGEPSVRTFGIKRLMQDHEIGEAAIMGTEGDMWRGIWSMKVDGEKNSARIGAESALYDLKMFGDWVRKHLKTQLGEDLFADSAKARKAKANDAKPVYMRRLNKDGGESGLRDAVTFHNTEEEAKAHHDLLVKNNPRQKIAHHMYSYNGDETFKTKFVGGKLVPLKGGINGSDEDRLEDATHDFIQMLDDEGSAAGMWMPYTKKVELYKLYRAKHKIKSVGVDTEDLEPAKADAKVDKKVIALGARGWKLFAKEENGDYVDMVFTKAP